MAILRRGFRRSRLRPRAILLRCLRWTTGRLWGRFSGEHARAPEIPHSNSERLSSAPPFRTGSAG
eukprot:5276593-Pyramimonas_sp.AAC.1